jgi:hypothetical protein
MAPERIVIIRHAEKPKKASPDLSVKGRMRALGLSKTLPKFVKPDFVFACKDSEASDRPYETILPTAKKLKKKIDMKFKDKDIKELVKELEGKKYDGKTILICWHHGMMPKLIEKLGLTSPYKKWPENLFDRIINIEGGELENLPQHLLYGDTEK